MGVKMNLRITMKNHAADPEIGFLTKSISKPYGRATAMPPAWGLIIFNFSSLPTFHRYQVNHLAQLLQCRLKCIKRMEMQTGEYNRYANSDFLPVHYHYLMFATVRKFWLFFRIFLLVKWKQTVRGDFFSKSNCYYSLM